MTAPHPPRRSADEQALLDAALADLFQRQIVFNQLLGLKVVGLPPSAPLRLQFEMRHELIGHHLHGRLHGGVISATLDATGGLATMAAMGEKFAHESAAQVMHRFMKLGTIDLRVDYLRPGLGRHFVATAEVIRLGGRIASTQMRLTNDEGTLIATGAAAYVVA